MSFNCDKCGICCKSLKGETLYKELDRGDGVCKYLDKNLCSIYDNRPEICNVDKSYDIYFSNLCSYDEYIKLNYEACKRLKEKYKE